MFKKIAIASVAAALFSIGQASFATSTTNTLNVTATVNKSCLVTTAPVDYSGTYDPVSANAATPAGDITFSPTIQFKCSKNLAGVTVGISRGGNYVAAPTGRKLADTGAANYLSYDLFQPASVGGACAYTQSYDTTGAGLFGVAGTNFSTSTTVVTVSICGKIPGAQDVPATGAYTDAVTVNVNF